VPPRWRPCRQRSATGSPPHRRSWEAISSARALWPVRSSGIKHSADPRKGDRAECVRFEQSLMASSIRATGDSALVLGVPGLAMMRVNYLATPQGQVDCTSLRPGVAVRASYNPPVDSADRQGPSWVTSAVSQTWRARPLCPRKRREGGHSNIDARCQGDLVNAPACIPQPAVEYSSPANRLEALLHLLHDVVDAEARRSLARRKLLRRHERSRWPSLKPRRPRPDNKSFELCIARRKGQSDLLTAMPRRCHMQRILAGRQLANDGRRPALAFFEKSRCRRA
jgi:hypothetical protein